MFLCNALPSGCESVLWLSSEMKLFERGQLSATLRFLSAIKDYFFFFFSSFFFPLSLPFHIFPFSFLFFIVLFAGTKWRLSEESMANWMNPWRIFW